MKVKLFSVTVAGHHQVHQAVQFGVQRLELLAMLGPTVAIDVRELQVSEDLNGEVVVRENHENVFAV